MSKTTNIKYRQCSLSKREGTATRETVSWLPTHLKIKGGTGKMRLEVGNVVDLKEDDGTWTKDWTVLSIGENEIDNPPDWRALIKGHRKNTGDSTPRRT